MATLKAMFKLFDGYSTNTASQITKIKGIPNTSGIVIWYKQFERKANLYKKKIEIILGNGWEKLNDGKKIKELIDSIIKNSDSSRLINDWSRTNIKDNKEFASDRCFSIIKRQQGYELKVNYDMELTNLFNEVRILSGVANNNFTGNIINNSIEHKSYYPYVVALQNSFKSLQNCEIKIKEEQRIEKLVAKMK